MVIYSRTRSSSDRLHTMIRCTTNVNRGNDACANSRSISVDRIVALLYGEAQRRVLERGLLDELIAETQARLGQMFKEDPAPLHAELSEARQQLQNIEGGIAALGPTEGLRERHRTTLVRIQELERRTTQAQAQRWVPSADQLRRLFQAMLAESSPGTSTYLADHLRQHIAEVIATPVGRQWRIEAYWRLTMVEPLCTSVL